MGLNKLLCFTKIQAFKINENAGPYIGLVMTFPTEELALIDSTFFVPSSEIPWVDLAGTFSLCLCHCFWGYLGTSIVRG